MRLFKNKKIILQLCADTGSDTKPYKDAGYTVILIGSEIGVENYHPPKGVYGIIANPVCREFSIARSGGKARNPEGGMFLVNECIRIIEEAKANGGLKFWAIENPATGALRHRLGTPRFVYEPWQFGSPWTKKTALWGEFNIPEKKYLEWADVPKIAALPTYQGRQKPSIAKMHRGHVRVIPEFAPFMQYIMGLPSKKHFADTEFRSLCSQKFATAFMEANR